MKELILGETIFLRKADIHRLLDQIRLECVYVRERKREQEIEREREK